MKQLLILITAFSLFATSCNNDKSSKNDRDTKSTTKDDYRDNDTKNSEDDEDKKSTDDGKDDSKKTTGARWTTSEETKFINECVGSAEPNVGRARAEEYCDCMLKKMERLYSSYNEANTALMGSSQDEINQLAAECNSQ